MSKDEKIKEILECHDKLKAQMLSITKDKNDADELLQKTYEKALNNLDKYTLGSNACGWMFNMAKNLLIDGTRKKSKKVTDLYGDWTETQIGTEYSTEDKHIQTEYKQQIKAMFDSAINELPDKLRDVFKLHYYKGMDAVDISLQIKVAVNEVKCRIVQSIDYLKYGILKDKYKVELEELNCKIDENKRYCIGLFDMVDRD